MNNSEQRKDALRTVVMCQMSDNERKNWIYEHIDTTHIDYLIESLSDDEVKKELNKITN